MPEQKSPKECKWTYYRRAEYYVSECGFSYFLDEGTPDVRDGDRYCIHCGGRIVVVAPEQQA